MSQLERLLQPPDFEIRAGKFSQEALTSLQQPGIKDVVVCNPLLADIDDSGPVPSDHLTALEALKIDVEAHNRRKRQRGHLADNLSSSRAEISVTYFLSPDVENKVLQIKINRRLTELATKHSGTLADFDTTQATDEATMYAFLYLFS